MANPQRAFDLTKNDEVQTILDLLQEGEKKIVWTTNKNAVLLLGTTGSGKSTFTQFIAGNNDDLESIEIGEDSGEYIIVDKNDKISNNSTISSKTIFPELVIDSKTKTAFYDCPGFSDTRSPAHDIAANYFIKKIIDTTESIKIVFTISHPSVRPGVDRSGFMTLVKHVVKMIKNIDKFKQSMALIVTKVDPQYKKGKLVPDESVINSIASFMNGVKDELQSKITGKNFDQMDNVFYQNAISLISELLDQRNKEYVNIGIFRRPDEAGPISKIKLLQDRKPLLEKLVHENIKFSTHDKNDFGYTISPESKNYMHDLIDKINDNIVTDILNISEDIEKYYYNQEEQTYDIKNLHIQFTKGYSTFLATKVKTSNLVQPQDLVKELTKNMVDLNITVSHKILEGIIKYGEYLKFLKTIDEGLVVVKPVDWAEGLGSIVKYLNDSEKWYNFLIDFYDILSKYEIQRDISKYSDIADKLKYQIEVNVNNQEIIFEILKQLLSKGSQDPERDYNKIKDVTLTKVKLKFLTDIVNLTLKHNIDTSCVDNKLIIKGQYVKLSDTAIENCKNSKYIEIFALNKMFIDADLDRTGKEVQLAIIAPTWDVVGGPKITLDGYLGEPHEPRSARNGVGPGRPGEVGKPGKPGGAAGNLLGFAENVINSEFIHISVKGGKGGPGQHGGNGINGKDGTTPSIPSNGPKPTWNKGFLVFDDIKEEHTQVGPQAYIDTYDGKWWVYGENCTNGGNGGNGGQGGKGGQKILDPIIVILNNETKISVSHGVGETGDPGNGGENSGHTSRSGKHLFLKGRSVESRFNFQYPKINYKFTVKELTDMENCHAGISGTKGQNSNGIQDSKPTVTSHIPASITNNYKKYLRNNLNGNIMEPLLRKFLTDLEQHKSIQNLYDLFGFVNELQNLEEQFYKLKRKLSVSTFYKTILKRTLQYTNKLYKEKKLTEDSKKVLSYLYTTILSKIYSIENSAGNNIIINLLEYLKLTVEEINKLKDFSNIVMVNESQKKYQNSLKAKINEAQDFIHSQITPEISNVFYEIDNQIELLINETIALQNKTVEEKKKLEEYRTKLQSTLTLKTLFGIPKLALQFLGFAGPLGAAAGAVIGGGIMIAESLALDNSNGPSIENIVELPAALKTSISKISEQLKNKQLLLQDQLADAQQELKKFLEGQSSSSIGDIQKKISEIKNKLEQEMAKGNSLDPSSVDKMYNMRKELIELLQEKKKILEKEKPGEDLNTKKQLKMIQRVQNIISATQIGIDFYKELKKDKTKIDELGLAIQKADKKIEALMLYEKSIYNTIVTTCRNIENKINEMENNLKDKSHAALDINKWKIQSTLRDIKLQMQKMTKGFSVQEDLARCIEKLEEGMFVMINVYDRIEDYHDKAEVADYVANINSNKAEQIQINDEKLVGAINYLKLIIQSNVVLEKYAIAMNAFKQYIYPFGNHFLAEFDLPPSLNSNDTNYLVTTVVSKINVLKTKLIESSITINKYDKFIHNKIEFDSKTNQSSPFFVWDYNNYKNAISRLLKGEEITLKSDVTLGLNKNAVKFNTVGINFKLTNASMQNELNKQLENFKVEMIHLGNSYYKCENRFYMIESDHQFISYSFARNKNGDPKDTNNVYDKLKSHEPLLSPYAMWNIQLKHIGNNMFDSLNKYKNEAIDLELEGTGQYVDRGIDVCNDDLNICYRQDSTISEFNNLNLYDKYIFSEIKTIKSFSTLGKFINRAKYDVKRERRSIEETKLIDKMETNHFATSGACNNVKSSFVNNIFNLIGTGLAVFNYLNPTDKIGQLLTKKDKENFKEKSSLSIDHNIFSDMPDLNIQLDNAPKLEKISSYINEESTTINNAVNTTILCNHGNLLLLDFIIRHKSGMKHKHKKIVPDKTVSSKYSSSLAYQAYVPNS